MDLTGEERIQAPRQAVWDAMNDVDVLKPCIPGCETLERLSETDIQAAILVNLSLIKIRFHGLLILSNLNPPFSYTISGEGQGSLAGFAAGSADVELIEESPDVTILRYTINGDAGGKIAQLGTKLLGNAARKIADRFFANIGEAAAQSVRQKTV
ncbi:carbon monoxide dehydrogenase subunit G [Pseudochrobactrum sp. sp1633]|uniref:CoxG family protein n=1 Tax=Pseudochrobactrum sp. sp1633 TaxID=3036706 RepID=UPI0025A62B49|nr:carbon monoxide dehydrogenase subunit G [Pseudochrobactrum sp. sp1633]MDM8344379.1 carbon monoxide dehydrogenase subunit G [Pseudochrobactrum sp. sp1633]HWD14489.1 carbon monoxide dehydrogenase subunit G [Pseudochrobactrum sp.]